ncbi:potential zinc finger protein [Pseudozyma hubeiensis SY62]|uniref:Potential zinc finger protein n=1 Tax=Pseudozyma hubeiensis (strain SY62) TaxID=1305764 RepID=R9PAS5_PSEHS|nr:potential zinc finger protein [Pseudozyma hubeiensis SY62]GAC98476.1 potential zinc finger protein [Pseudozyma hubeiensis SY62]
MWPVSRLQYQPQQGSAPDRSRDSGAFSHGFPQPDAVRQQGHPANYTYEGSSSALRNPIVYSQPAQQPWGMGASSSADYAEYPTASFMTPTGQRSQPPMNGQGPYLGNVNAGYGESSLASGSDPYPKVMSGSYDPPAETLWPLGPNSLDAFAGMPAPTGQVARLTLTSAADKNRFKARSSLPPPKQFKCSACDAIFSRNHDLKRHARIHLAVKPFPCGYCDKAFSRKDALKRHVLVKGCGIGNKKSSDNRKRAATLSKLENSESGSNSRAPYDGAPSRDFGHFRNDLQYQDGQQQGFQSEPGSSRSFPGRMDAAWPSTMSDGSNPGMNAEYASSRGANNDERAQAPHGLQMSSQAGLVPSYGSQHQSHPYPNFGMSGDDGLQQQQQRTQLAGGLVNAFPSPATTSTASPTDVHAKTGLAGNAGAPGSSDGLEHKLEARPVSRPGSGKLPHAAAYNAQPFPVAGSGDSGAMNAPGLAAGGYSMATVLSPSMGGGDLDAGNAHSMKRQQQQQQQQQFGSYYPDSAAN